MNHINPEMQQCIDNCTSCHATCLSALSQHCLEAGGKHTEPAHVRLMLDCAQICATSADFLLRGSAHHALTCGVCAQVCRDCADSCEAVGGMDDCVQACRQCAQTCAAMSQAA